MRKGLSEGSMTGHTRVFSKDSVHGCMALIIYIGHEQITSCPVTKHKVM